MCSFLWSLREQLDIIFYTVEITQPPPSTPPPSVGKSVDSFCSVANNLGSTETSFFPFPFLVCKQNVGLLQWGKPRQNLEQPILDISREMELGQRENVEQSEGDASYTSAEEDNMQSAVHSDEGWCLSHVSQAFLPWQLASESLWLRGEPSNVRLPNHSLTLRWGFCARPVLSARTTSYSFAGSA